jgi:autotransporter adhesin
MAIGNGTTASANNAIAVGANARAEFVNATAIGANTVATAANQITLGSSGTSVRIGDIAASTSAQVGPVQAVTVDASGTLGRQSVASAQAVQAVSSALQQVAAISDTQFTALDARVGTLFDLREHDRKDFRQGIAAVAAMAAPHFPSEAGRTSYASNVALFRGEVGFSAGIAHRFDGDFALTAGATFAGGKNTAVRAGVAGEF